MIDEWLKMFDDLARLESLLAKNFQSLDLKIISGWSNHWKCSMTWYVLEALKLNYFYDVSMVCKKKI